MLKFVWNPEARIISKNASSAYDRTAHRYFFYRNGAKHNSILEVCVNARQVDPASNVRGVFGSQVS